jgi:hypothetical protein
MKSLPFVLNVTEPGFQDWADGRESKFIVPCRCRHECIIVPVEKRASRSSFRISIALDGAYLKILLILLRETINHELAE